MTQNDKKFCLSQSASRNCKSYDCEFWHTWVIMISPVIFFFFIFSKFWYFWFIFGKRLKKDLKLPISVCHALYIRNCRSYHWDFWKIMIYPGVFLYFLKKMQHCKYCDCFVFYRPTSTVFFNNSYFSSSSINTKKKF